MNATILVTGGSGFIGRYVLLLLAQRADTVVNFDVREPGPEAAWVLKSVADRVCFVQGSIDDWAGAVAVVKEHQPDAIVHIAAIVRADVLSRRPDLAFKVNLGGTLNVLEAARLFGVKRVVNFSSVGIFPAIQYEPVDANHPLMLATEGPFGGFYGAAKVAAEAFCWGYRQSFGLDFITLRPSAVYGFGMQWPIYIKPMVENSVRGLPTRFENGREYPRDYTHVADVARLAVRAVDVPADKVQDRVFYGATGQPLVTAGEVAEIVRSLVPDADIEIGPGLSEADLVRVRCRGMLSIQDAQEQLGYEPHFVSIRDGVADYIETYRRYLAETAQSQLGGPL